MKVLIAGGGIAGPAAAIALAKAGIEAEVLEAHPPADDEAGAFLTLTANGQDALAAIDADEAVLAASFPANRLQVFGPDGDLLAGLPAGRGQAVPRTITRAALSRLLREQAARRGIGIRYGRRVTSATADSGGGVAVTCSDGSHATGDLLIGADGIHSPVRALIDPDAPAPRPVGLTVACGYTKARPPAEAGTDGYAMYYGSRAFFGCTVAPDQRTWWFARVPGPPGEAGRATADGIAAAFGADGTPAARLIRATPGPLAVTSAYDLAHLPAWSNAAMVVIGDAAHAASPATTQGASLAIEDGVTLARCLRDLPRQADALAAYERLRRARVEGIVRAGASGDNPVPGRPRPRDGDQAARPPQAHHIDWDARVTDDHA